MALTKVSSGVVAPGTAVSNIGNNGIQPSHLSSGMVIQTRILNSRTRTTLAPGNTLTEVSSNYRVSITPLYSNSMILLTYHVPASTSNPWAANYIMDFDAVRYANGTAYNGSYSTVSSVGASNGSRKIVAGQHLRSSNGYDYNDGIPIVSHAIDFPGTTSAIQYGFRMSTEGGTMYYGYSSSDNGSWAIDSNIIIIAQEIKQ